MSKKLSKQLDKLFAQIDRERKQHILSSKLISERHRLQDQAKEELIEAIVNYKRAYGNPVQILYIAAHDGVVSMKGWWLGNQTHLETGKYSEEQIDYENR